MGRVEVDTDMGRLEIDDPMSHLLDELGPEVQDHLLPPPLPARAVAAVEGL